MYSSTHSEPQNWGSCLSHSTHVGEGKPVFTVQEAGWASGPVNSYICLSKIQGSGTFKLRWETGTKVLMTATIMFVMVAALLPS